MTEVLSNKELAALAQKLSMSCPNCGGQLSLVSNCRRGGEEDALRAIFKLMAQGIVRLAPIEDCMEADRKVVASHGYSVHEDYVKMVRGDDNE